MCIRCGLPKERHRQKFQACLDCALIQAKRSKRWTRTGHTYGRRKNNGGKDESSAIS